ncbi:F-box protein At4g00755-like isoform X2 [Lycium ferocissimum]|uniref:F-box protein At4g00755-like isoform X2 n=1 Tax=Lycium ferocissimum TaxID=112874 RepID=UPI002815398C|nr:F-box protein At4g00755-like isoform X2 [Lycium ferocissimum]
MRFRRKRRTKLGEGSSIQLDESEAADLQVEARVDFVLWLENDVSLNILMRLDDPTDVLCAGAVSRLWHQFVVTNGISKQLCLRKFPQLSTIARITEPYVRVAERKDVESSNSGWETLNRDHNVYAYLLHDIGKLNICTSDCIGNAVTDSIRDNDDLDESIFNTLIPMNMYRNRPSYWSSKGHSDPNAPEMLIYKLKADLCVITEINIQPFEVWFHSGKPIHSAKSVRFRLGHLKSSRDKRDLLHLPEQQPADDEFVWTYTSEEFPMRQENRLQQFKLPESVLCIDGYLQIELLGIAERCEIDDLF